MKGLLAAALLVAVVVPQPAAARPAVAASDRFSLNPQRIDRTLQGFVTDRRVAGAAVLVWQGGRERHFRAAGLADSVPVGPLPAIPWCRSSR